MCEEWKDIKGYEGKYQISNFGRVKSLDYRGIGKEKILRLNKRNGYLRVGLCKNCKEIKYSVHRLVAEAFIPNPDNKPEINHINTIRDDNRVENLEWCTRIENQNNPLTIEKHRIKMLGNQYNTIPIVQLKNGCIIGIWKSSADASRKLNLNNSFISNCCNKRQYKNENYYKSAYGYQWQFVDDYLADWWDKEMEKGA